MTSFSWEQLSFISGISIINYPAILTICLQSPHQPIPTIPEVEIMPPSQSPPELLQNSVFDIMFHPQLNSFPLVSQISCTPTHILDYQITPRNTSWSNIRTYVPCQIVMYVIVKCIVFLSSPCCSFVTFQSQTFVCMIGSLGKML